MIEAEAIQQVNEILGRRREYFSRFDRIDQAAALTFSDVDYTFAWYLVSRLGITSIQADTTEVAGLFSGSTLAVSTAGQGMTAVSASADTIDTLYLFSPAHRPPAAWLKGATAARAIAICYGLTDALGPEWVDATKTLGTMSPVFIPLFGAAPGLWRAASFIICRRTQQPEVNPVVRKFVSAFAGEDLDPLLLAEQNQQLRVKLQRLSAPGGDEGEVERLQTSVTKLEALIASLRRAGLQQEKTIAAIRQSHGSTAARVATQNGVPDEHPVEAGKQA